MGPPRDAWERVLPPRRDFEAGWSQDDFRKRFATALAQMQTWPLPIPHASALSDLLRDPQTKRVIHFPGSTPEQRQLLATAILERLRIGGLRAHGRHATNQSAHSLESNPRRENKMWWDRTAHNGLATQRDIERQWGVENLLIPWDSRDAKTRSEKWRNTDQVEWWWSGKHGRFNQVRRMPVVHDMRRADNGPLRDMEWFGHD